MTETMTHGYSSQRELSNEYQHDRVKMIFIIFRFFVHWTKVTSAAEGFRLFISAMNFEKVRVRGDYPI